MTISNERDDEYRKIWNSISKPLRQRELFYMCGWVGGKTMPVPMLEATDFGGAAKQFIEIEKLWIQLASTRGEILKDIHEGLEGQRPLLVMFATRGLSPNTSHKVFNVSSMEELTGESSTQAKHWFNSGVYVPVEKLATLNNPIPFLKALFS